MKFPTSLRACLHQLTLSQCLGKKWGKYQLLANFLDFMDSPSQTYMKWPLVQSLWFFFIHVTKGPAIFWEFLTPSWTLLLNISYFAASFINQIEYWKYYSFYRYSTHHYERASRRAQSAFWVFFKSHSGGAPPNSVSPNYWGFCFGKARVTRLDCAAIK